MPTDGLAQLRDMMQETEAYGFERVQAQLKTFRIGLFGLDKLHQVERTVANLRQALDKAL